MNIILTLGTVYHQHQFVVLVKVRWKLQLIHQRQSFYTLLQIKEGEHIFATTLKEHNQNVFKYQKNK